MTGKKDVAASVRQRLLNRAHAERRPFNELLQYYAMDRFLYRLTQSAHSERFILKGALVMAAWDCPVQRPTMDIDLLARTSNAEENILGSLREVMACEVAPDGLDFVQDSLRIEQIVDHAEYGGLRARFEGRLGTARVHMQVDIGFGDAVHPAPAAAELPPVLDGPPSRLLCYSRESVIAEKIEAMVRHGQLNTRMKDFFDVWHLSRQFDFEGAVLVEAVRLTLERRETTLVLPLVALSSPFIADKQVQWSAFLNRARIEQAPASFRDVALDLETFVGPVLAIAGTPALRAIGNWSPSTGWSAAAASR